MPQDHKFEYDGERARFDRVITQQLEGISRMQITQLIKSGHATIDGNVITSPSRLINAGTHLTLTIPDPVAAQPTPQAMPLDIIYEDSDIIVINKPIGLVVHPGAGNHDMTLVNGLLAHCADSLSGIGGVNRPGIVHRLDKDTTGAIVCAKHDRAHHGLATQFAVHSAYREYRCVVHGLPKSLKGTINAAIMRHPRERLRMAISDAEQAKHAITHYKTIGNLGTILSIIDLQLQTGRTHQIRVHMAHLGVPVLGDLLYGSPHKRAQSLAQLTDTPLHAIVKSYQTQALHARILHIKHPVSGEKMQFYAPPPPDFAQLLQILGHTDIEAS